MISKLSNQIVNLLCDTNAITKDEQELFRYGFFLLLSRMFFFIVTLLFGLFWGVPWESMVFYLTFSVLREYAGGVHASKEVSCMFFTTTSMFACVTGIWLLKTWNSFEIPMTLLLICGVIVIYLSPLESSEKPLTTSERKHYGKLASRIVIGLALVAILGVAVKFYTPLYINFFCVFLECILLLLGKIKTIYHS